MQTATAIKITYKQPIGLYEDAVKQLFPDGEHAAEGNIFHWVEETSDGFIVHDVWTSQEAFEAFVAESLAPLGMPEPDAVEVKPVYNYLIGAEV